MRRRLLVIALAPALLLVGCTPTVSLEPAPQATDVGCAGVVVRLPVMVGDQSIRQTDAQGTAAWGTPASVTLRCGLTPVVVSGDTCATVGGVDWLLMDRPQDSERIATTFGREPAVQMVVVVGPSSVSMDDVLPAVSDAVEVATKRTGLVCVDHPAPAAGLSPTASVPLETHGPPASR